MDAIQSAAYMQRQFPPIVAASFKPVIARGNSLYFEPSIGRIETPRQTKIFTGRGKQPDIDTLDIALPTYVTGNLENRLQLESKLNFNALPGSDVYGRG